MDIITLRETRLSSSGSVKEKDFTFFWQGRPPEETRVQGVGFAIRNKLLISIRQLKKSVGSYFAFKNLTKAFDLVAPNKDTEMP